MAGEVSNALIKEKDPIASLLETINTYSGKSSTSTSTNTTGPSTTTTKSNITPEQMSALISSAMAPLSRASKGAGISTYSDTTLALGRGQIAAELGAKYAGSTTTESGRTSTQTQTQTQTQNPITGKAVKSSLMPSLLGAIVKSGVTSPITKALAKRTGLEDLSKRAGSFIENFGTDSPVTGAAGTALESFRQSEILDMNSADFSSAAPDIISSAVSDFSSPAADIISNAVDTDVNLFSELDVVGDSIASDLASDNLSEVFSDFDWLGFADGGEVRTKKYADGGNVKYVDRFVPRYNMLSSSKRYPSIDAIVGEMPLTASPSISAGSGKKNPLDQVSAIDSGNSGDSGGYESSGSSGSSGDTSSVGIPSGGFDLSGSRLGVAAALGAARGGLPGAIFGVAVNSLSQLAEQALSRAMSPATVTPIPNPSIITVELPPLAEEASISEVVAESARQAAQESFRSSEISQQNMGGESFGGYSGTSSETGVGNPGESSGPTSSESGAGNPGESGSDSSSSSGSDSGGSDSGGDGWSAGGDVQGPGTKTSDSISARLSDGERVITAETNEAVEKMFPGFFHMLEQEFNPQAAMAQIQKGRA